MSFFLGVHVYVLGVHVSSDITYCKQYNALTKIKQSKQNRHDMIPVVNAIMRIQLSRADHTTLSFHYCLPSKPRLNNARFTHVTK